MLPLFARLFGRPTAPVRRPAPGFGLRLETLEVREVPAARLVPDHHLILHGGSFDTAMHHTTHNQQRVEKLHILTAHNLSAGNYTVSYHAPRR